MKALSYATEPMRRMYRKMKTHGVIHRGNYRRMAAIFLKMSPGIFFRYMEKKKYEPRVSALEQTDDPVFVIGHWRSGTTYLQFLLSRDPQFVWHDKYQGLFPDIYLSTSKSLRPLADRFLNMFRAVGEWKKNISADMDLDSPIEIESAYVNAALPATYHWGHVFPRAWEQYSRRFLYMNSISDRELIDWKESLIYACKKIRYNHPDRRILIKNPGDTARIDHIRAVYPNAKFVFIHRNPYDVFYSNKKLWRGILKSIALQSLGEQELKHLILTTYSRLHKNYIRRRAQIPKDQIAEVGLEDLNRDPAHTVERIYRQLNLGNFEEIRPRILNYARKPNKRKLSGYDYEDVDIRRINDRWNFAFEQWGYEVIEPLKTSPQKVV